MTFLHAQQRMSSYVLSARDVGVGEVYNLHSGDSANPRKLVTMTHEKLIVVLKASRKQRP